MKLSNLIWIFWNEGMERKWNEWNVSNFIWSNIEGKEWNNFMTILLLDPYLKINGWISRSILGVLIKISLNLISFPPFPPNFWGNENLRF